MKIRPWSILSTTRTRGRVVDDGDSITTPHSNLPMHNSARRVYFSPNHFHIITLLVGWLVRDCVCRGWVWSERQIMITTNVCE